MKTPRRTILPIILLAIAAVLAGGLGLSGLLGHRENISVTLQTAHVTGPEQVSAAATGALYALLYASTVILAPILALSAALYWATVRTLTTVMARRNRPEGDTP